MLFWEGRGGGTPLRHGHKESYKDLNLKNSTSELDSNPRPHEYQSDALTTELTGDRGCVHGISAINTGRILMKLRMAIPVHQAQCV